MFKRTLYLFFGILLAISSGSVSIYPIYSFYIKNKYNYSLREINLYGSFINIGCWVAFGVGIIYDKLGPIVSNVIGFILLPGGFMVLHKLIDSSDSSVNLLWFLLIAFIMGQGSALIYTNALSTNIKNFSKKNSSNIVGLVISNCAIAPSLFASFKASFKSMTIPGFISFVIVIISIIILFSCCYFRIEKEKKIYDFNKKVFQLNKQTFILGLFIYTNFIGLVIFIATLVINHMFQIELPAFMVFPVIHIIFIVYICIEKCNQFDDYLDGKFQQNHRNNVNYFDTFDRVKDVPLEENQNKFDDKNNKKELELNNSPLNKNNDVNDKKDENKEGRYTQNEPISRMSNKLEFNDNQDEMNKKENSQDVHMSRNTLNFTFKNNGNDNENENDENYRKTEGNNNINNQGEYIGEENGRFSNNNDVNENNRNSVNNKDEDNNDDNNNINDEENKNGKDNDNDNNNDKEDENNINNKEDNAQEIEGDEEKENENEEKENNSQEEKNDEDKDNELKEKEKENNDDNNNINNDNNENNNNNIENNDNNNENNIENSYPKFSINNNEDNNENNNNNNEYNGGENFKSNNNINIPNPYPKFSINSNENDNNNGNGNENNIENPYPKFSITKDEKENEKENNNDENNNNIVNDKHDENTNSKNDNLKDDEENKDKDKNEDGKIEEVNPNIIFNKKLQKSSSKKKILDMEKKEDFNTATSYDFNNTANAIIINNISPLEINASMDEDDEKEESHNKCVLLLSLFRKPQILKFFFVLLLTMGCMISNINNIKFIVSSISSDHSLNLVSLDKYPLIYFSFNSLSRVMTGGMVKEVMGGEYTFYCLYVIVWLGFISQLIGWIMTKFTIYISISLAGITHGSIMTFAPLYCRYYYSVNDLGTVLGFLTTGNAIGSILIATLIFPHFYHTNSQYDKYSNEEYCSGKGCFRKSYLINSLFMFIALILSYSIYKKDKQKKIKEKEDRMNMYKNSAFCSFNPRISQGSDNSNQAI